MSPSGPLGNIGPLSPINGGTAAASLSPLGQPTRVPPPATGSYSAPNNYMGGSPPVGQAYNSVAPYDSFSNNLSGIGPVGSDVAPTSYVEQVPNGVALPGASPSQRSLSPTLGGMRIIDMTQAPAPPGYQPQYPSQQYQAPQFQQPLMQQPQYPTGQYPTAQYPEVQNFGGQNFGGQNATGVYQPPYNVPPQGYDVNQNGYPMQTIQVPSPGEIASGQVGSRIQPNVGYGPSASIASGREFPMQPSISEPSFQGGSQFPANQPSTEPIDSRFESQQENLPWRRPGTQF